jgi:tetratricopeptide (TPR) repeat protein
LLPSIDEADAEVACLFAERCLEWFFCSFVEGPRLPALTADGAPAGLSRDERLRGLLLRLESPGCDPDAELARPGWEATAPVAALLAETLIGRGRLAEADACLRSALARHGDDVRLRQLEGLWLSRSGRFAEAVARLRRVFDNSPNDEETRGILGGVCKRRWQQDRTDRAALEAAHENYLRGWEASIRENLYLGTNAAATALWLGRRDEAGRLANQVRDKVRAREGKLRKTAAGGRLADNYWDRASLAEVALLRGEVDEARRLYREAFALDSASAGSHRSTRDQLADLLPAFGLEADVDAFLASGGPLSPAAARSGSPTPGSV